jgi:streptogrisin C
VYGVNQVRMDSVAGGTFGRTVNGLVRTSACAAPGDSDGSFVHADHAQGLTSGITNRCGSGSGTDSSRQPVREVLNAHNLNLVTG